MIEHKNTKELLADSIKELAKSKSVEKISVREIVSNAGLTHMTFYNHFRNKYELIAWIYNVRICPSLGQLWSGVSWREAVRHFVDVLLEEPDFYMNVLKNTYGETSVRYAANNFAIDMILEKMRCTPELGNPSKETIFFVKFYMRAISESINDWFLNGRHIPVEQFIDMLVSAMPVKLVPFFSDSAAVCSSSD